MTWEKQGLQIPVKRSVPGLPSGEETEKPEGAREHLASFERNGAKNESSGGEASGEEGILFWNGTELGSIPL